MKNRILAIIVVIIFSAFLVFLNALGVLLEKNQYDDFAKCLSVKNAIMYGSDACPACNKQKELFGDSFRYVTYINCMNNQQACSNDNIASIPAWKINNNKYIGVQQLSILAQLSGCSL